MAKNEVRFIRQSEFFGPSFISRWVLSRVDDIPDSFVISCSSNVNYDPLQCFLPAPLSYSSLLALLPSPSFSESPSSSSSSSSPSCFASISVPESLKTQALRKEKQCHPSPIEFLASSLQSLCNLKQPNNNSFKWSQQHNGERLTSRKQEKQQHDVASQKTPSTDSNPLPLDTMKMSKHLLAGAMSAVVSRTLVAPLERLKLEYIVRGAKNDAVDVVKRIMHEEGIPGFWKGNLVNLIRTAPFKSINFFTYDMLRKQITNVSGRKEISHLERLAAGATAGILATIICFPMDTIRTKMVAPGGEALGGITGCFRHMLRTEGPLSLYAGIVPALISMAPAGAVFYGVYDILKSSYLSSASGIAHVLRRNQTNSSSSSSGRKSNEQMELGALRTLLYGAIAGACAETVTYPFEVVRRKLQLQDAAHKLGLISTVKELVEQDGFSALYAGLFPSTLQVLPSAALSYFVYEWLKITFKVS